MEIFLIILYVLLSLVLAFLLLCVIGAMVVAGRESREEEKRIQTIIRKNCENQNNDTNKEIRSDNNND